MTQAASDALYRAVRTFLQAFLGVFLAQAGAVALSAAKGEYVLDIEWWKRIAISALVAGVCALASFAQNWLEDHKVLPTILKPRDRAVGDAVLGEDANVVQKIE